MRPIHLFFLTAALFLSGYVVIAGSASDAASAPRPCSHSDLQIALHSFLSGLGSVNDLFWVKNIGDSSCTLRGYPEVTFYGPHVTRLSVTQANIADRDGNDIGGLKIGVALPTAVLKAHNELASFMIYGTDEQHGSPPSTCIETRKMVVSLPNVTGLLTVLMPVGSAFYWCGGISVHPIVPGRTGADPPISILPG